MILSPGCKIIKVDPITFNGMGTVNQRKQGSSIVEVRNGVLYCEAKAIDERAYGYLNFFVPGGAAIEVRCFARQLGATSAGRISIDQHATNDDIGGDNIDYVEMDSTIWKPYSIYAAGRDDRPYVGVTFGIWKNVLGACEFRDIEIILYGVPQWAPEFRACTFYIEKGNITIDQFSVPTSSPNFPNGFEPRFSNMGIHSIEWQGTSTIKVNWDPFRSYYRPQCFVQVDCYDNFDGYTAHPRLVNWQGAEILVNRMDNKDDSSVSTTGTNALSRTDITNLTKNRRLCFHLLALSAF